MDRESAGGRFVVGLIIEESIARGSDDTWKVDVCHCRVRDVQFTTNERPPTPREGAHARRV